MPLIHEPHLNTVLGDFEEGKKLWMGIKSLMAWVIPVEKGTFQECQYNTCEIREAL